MVTTTPVLPTRAPVHSLRWDGAPVTTWANLVTTLRTIAAVAIGLAAITESSVPMLVAAYAAYWVGDALDGWLARRLHQETRLGAICDIVCDRACCAVLVCGLVQLQPQLWPAMAVFLLQFLVVDCVLSLSFLRWRLLSPNQFHLVDTLVWRLNWSPSAKTVNTVGVVLAVVTGSLALALTIALAQAALKVWSARRILQLHNRT